MDEGCCERRKVMGAVPLREFEGGAQTIRMADARVGDLAMSVGARIGSGDVLLKTEGGDVFIIELLDMARAVAGVIHAGDL